MPYNKIYNSVYLDIISFLAIFQLIFNKDDSGKLPWYKMMEPCLYKQFQKASENFKSLNEIQNENIYTNFTQIAFILNIQT